MRTAVFLLLGLLLLGLWLGNCDGESLGDSPESSSSGTREEVPWVRTVDGWERAVWMATPKAGYRPGLHPLVVALFVGLSSTIALLVFSPESEPQSDE